MQFLDLLFSVAQFIFVTTFKTSILVILILLVQLPLRKKIPAKWLHALWLLVLIRMLLPFELESKISLFNLIPVKNNPELVEETIAFPNETSPVFEMEYANDDVPIITSSDFPEASKQVFKILPIHYFSIFWILGVIVFMKITIANNIKFRNRIKNQQKITDKGILNLFYQCKKDMKVWAHIRLVEVNVANVPLLYGIFRPRILLPINFINRIDREELRYIFLHELAHYKRRDIFISLLTSILQILHWFNPIIWFAFFKMRIDRELATDEKTLSLIGSEKSQLYGRTIISMLEQISTKFRSPVTVGIIENKNDLKRRLTMISNFNKKSILWSFAAIVILLSLVGFSLTDAQKTTKDSKPYASEIVISFDKTGSLKMNEKIVLVDSLASKLNKFRFDENSIITIAPEKDVFINDYFKMQRQLQAIDVKKIKYVNAQSGKSVITSQYDFNEDIRIVGFDSLKIMPVNINGKYGYKNKKGEVVIEPKCDMAWNFNQGLAGVKIRNKWGFINRKCESVSEIIYEKIRPFSDGLAMVKFNGKWRYINKKFELVIPIKFDDAYSFREDLAPVKLKTKWGFIDRKGEMLIKPEFDKTTHFFEGMAGVENKNKWGFIDKNGTLVIDYQFSKVGRFTDDLALVKINGKYGYINKKGNFVIEPQFAHAESFSEGLAAVKIDGKYGYIDKTGNIVIEHQFDSVMNFIAGLAHVIIFENPELGIKGQGFEIDKAGNVIKSK